MAARRYVGTQGGKGGQGREMQGGKVVRRERCGEGEV